MLASSTEDRGSAYDDLPEMPNGGTIFGEENSIHVIGWKESAMGSPLFGPGAVFLGLRGGILEGWSLWWVYEGGALPLLVLGHWSNGRWSRIIPVFHPWPPADGQPDQCANLPIRHGQ